MKRGVLLRDGECLVGRAGGAFGWWSRLRGLLFRRPLAGDGSEALLIRPCSSIHTIGMGYALDVVFIDREGNVVKVREGVKPWRACFGRGAHAVIEFHHGAARRLRIAAGDRIEWRAA